MLATRPPLTSLKSRSTPSARTKLVRTANAEDAPAATEEADVEALAEVTVAVPEAAKIDVEEDSPEVSPEMSLETSQPLKVRKPPLRKVATPDPVARDVLAETLTTPTPTLREVMLSMVPTATKSARMMVSMARATADLPTTTTTPMALRAATTADPAEAVTSAASTTVPGTTVEVAVVVAVAEMAVVAEAAEEVLPGTLLPSNSNPLTKTERFFESRNHQEVNQITEGQI